MNGPRSFTRGELLRKCEEVVDKGYPPENAETQPYGVGGSQRVLIHFLEFVQNLSKMCLEGSWKKMIFLR